MIVFAEQGIRVQTCNRLNTRDINVTISHPTLVCVYITEHVLRVASVLLFVPIRTRSMVLSVVYRVQLDKIKQV